MSINNPAYENNEKEIERVDKLLMDKEIEIKALETYRKTLESIGRDIRKS